MEQRQRGFALAEVLPQRFAQPFAVGRVVERIVGDLEGHSEILAEPEECILLGLCGVGENGAHAAGGGNQAGRLVFDHFEIFQFRHGGVAIVIELQHFAFRHLLAGLGEHFVDPLAPEVDDLADGLGIEIVADEDADLVAPDFPGGSLASADIRIVDHIVVEQGRGMNELH